MHDLNDCHDAVKPKALGDEHKCCKPMCLHRAMLPNLLEVAAMSLYSYFDQDLHAFRVQMGRVLVFKLLTGLFQRRVL